jgi:hypothetical protein
LLPVIGYSGSDKNEYLFKKSVDADEFQTINPPRTLGKRVSMYFFLFSSFISERA